jgi:hypothetical protein
VGAAFDHGRQDAAEFADAEEAVATRVAAVGGKSQPAPQENQDSVFHSFAGDMLDIEIAAARAVREAFQDGCDAPGLKAVLAAVTAPGTQAGATEEEIEGSVAVRAKTIVTATLRTDHRYSECVAQNTEKPVRRQGGDNTDRQLNHNCDVPGTVTGTEPHAQPSGMDIAALLGDNFADTMRQAPRPRRLNEFDPKYAR